MTAKHQYYPRPLCCYRPLCFPLPDTFSGLRPTFFGFFGHFLPPTNPSLTQRVVKTVCIPMEVNLKKPVASLDAKN